MATYQIRPGSPVRTAGGTTLSLVPGWGGGGVNAADYGIQLPADRSLMGEGEASLAAREALAPRMASLQALLSRYQAEGNLAAAQAVMPGYVALQREAAVGTAGADVAAGEVRRSGDWAALNTYGADWANTLRGLDPAAEELRQGILASARAGLDAGISPAERRDVTQAARGDFNSRGLYRSNAAVAGEAVARDRAGFDRTTANRNWALSALGGASTYDAGRAASAQILGQPQYASPGFAGAALEASAGAPSANPWDAYAGDVFNTNYNAEATALITEANNRAALLQGGQAAAASGYQAQQAGRAARWNALAAYYGRKTA
jgi:hypothetical protein